MKLSYKYKWLNFWQLSNNERVRIITIIDNFTTIEEAMAFDIRDEDAKPFMDALYNLINSI